MNPTIPSMEHIIHIIPVMEHNMHISPIVHIIQIIHISPFILMFHMKI